MGKLIRRLRRATARYPDARSVVIRNALLRRQQAPVTIAGMTIAVQCLADPYYFGLFGAMCQHLRQIGHIASELVVVRSISGAVGDGWRERLERSTVMTYIASAPWIRLFQGIASRVAYRSRSFAHPLMDALDFFRARYVWRRARSHAPFAGLRILGVLVGDLVIDSYLRFRPAARFDCCDPFVLQLIRQAQRDIRRARRYFRLRQPKLYLTSYTTYIEHGIAVRVALQNGVRVRSFGNFMQFGKELSPSDWFHTPDTSRYRATFATLEQQDARLAQAEKQLRIRLGGGIDAGTSYMKASAYANAAEPLPIVAGAIVIFLHDFFDSPHVYGELVFDDFWEWVCFTVDTLTAAQRNFFLKPHPNQIEMSRGVLAQLTAKYPGLRVLPASVSNVQLAEAGIECGVTVYGTVAHELAFLGVPTISCARHPHHSFDFSRTAHTVEQYRDYLLSAQQMPVTREEMRRQALAFYYMHYLHGDAESLALRSACLDMWKACNDPAASHEWLAQQVRRLRDSVALQSAMCRIADELAMTSGCLEQRAEPG